MYCCYCTEENLMAINMEPRGRFGAALANALNSKEMSLKDLALKLDVSYEAVRKLYLNLSLPPRLTLKEICRLLDLKFKEMEPLVVQDRMDRQYGSARYNAEGRDPRLAEVEPLLSQLDETRYKAALAMLRGLARDVRLGR
jgi:transcriptional regulator with XRE-family HTH domain